MASLPGRGVWCLGFCGAGRVARPYRFYQCVSYGVALGLFSLGLCRGAEFPVRRS
jgi:hypothetical protein